MSPTGLFVFSFFSFLVKTSFLLVLSVLLALLSAGLFIGVWDFYISITFSFFHIFSL